MAILVGTARNRFPDFAEPVGGVQQFLDRSKEVISGFLEAADGRIFNNSFVEDGVQNITGSSFIDSKFSDLIEPTRRQVTTQFPQATVLLKKRMFSSLRTNYDIRFMDDDERIFMRAIKNLFRRKTEEISFYENLVVLEKLIQDPEFLNVNSFFDTYIDSFFTVANLGFGLTNLIGGATDVASALSNTILDGIVPDPKVFLRLKKIQERARQNKFTTWIIDPEMTNFSGTGPGVGVIEFTWMTKVVTTTSIRPGGGKCTITIEDPYRLTRITESDIDLALRQAFSEESGPVAFFDVTGRQQLEESQNLDMELNNLRAGRGVSQINFEYTTTGEPFATLVDFNIPFTVSTLNQIPSDQALGATEITRFVAIINNLRSYKAIQNRATTSIHTGNKKFGPIRDKMRREFVGHHIFQQMDSVHVFANSFTRDATPIYDSRIDLLLHNNLDKILTREEDTGKLDDEMLELERQAIAPEMSLIEYKVYRNPIEWRGTGPQLFEGLVEKVSSSYVASEGKFMLFVKANDNMEYLKLSRINQTPGLTQPQGVLEDPLTPYDIKVEPTTGIIEDRVLSETNRKRLSFLRFDDGPLLGETIDIEERLISDTAEGVSAILAYQHVPGLVYKWKEGIISATQDVNLTRPLSRRRATLGDIREDFGLTLTNSPFSNIDAADVISILITGQPYDYNNFLQSAIDSSNFTVDNDTNNRTYFNYLFDFLERQNQLIGGFIPAKRSNIDPNVSVNAFREQGRLTRFSSQLSTLQSKKARLLDRIEDLNAGKESLEISFLINDLGTQVASFDDQINRINAQATQASLGVNAGDAVFKQYGNAIQVHFRDEEHVEVRRLLRYALKNKPEEVRYNQDKRYFIVAEQYDIDANIRAYVLQLKNQAPDLFTSEYKTPLEICTQVANTIDFEFFADAQGNIQFRPPEYNKTPLSLLLRMAEMSATDGVSLIPQFLIKLLTSRTDLTRQKLFEIELQILEQGLLLGLSRSDFNGFGISLAVYRQRGGVSGTSLSVAGSSVNPNQAFSLSDNILLDSLESDSIFTEKQQTEAIFSAPASTQIDRDVESLNDTITDIIVVRNQLADLKGSTTPKLDSEAPDDRRVIADEIRKFDSAADGTYVSRLRATNIIAQLVSERQSLIQIFARLKEDTINVEELNDKAAGLKILAALTGGAAADLLGQPLASPTLPKSLRDLIIDDTANLDGFNSRKRYIIEDKQILTMDFSIEPPTFNRIDVNGTEDLVGQQLTEANALMFWAGATDFDSWRQFGFRTEAPLNRPFLKDPETQCAPYAVFKLLQQRRKIHHGTITIVGNEFYEPGDVVWINNRQLLYYVESVQQNINLSTGTFATTLTLTYGHALGEYIPTPLDAIGKAMLADKKRHFGDLKANRTAVPSADVVYLGTMAFPISSSFNDLTNLFASSDSGNNEGVTEGLRKLNEDFKRQNTDVAYNAIRKANQRINDTNSSIARIELRGYFTGFGSGEQRTRNFLNMADELLRNNNATINTAISNDINLKIQEGELPSSFTVSMNPLNVEIVAPINLTTALTEKQARLRRFPSAQAWACANEIQSDEGDGLPVNCIDIYYVVEKSRVSDTEGTQTLDDL